MFDPFILDLITLVLDWLFPFFDLLQFFGLEL
jgi:hypothetical protein